jgi:hypothetical protein
VRDYSRQSDGPATTFGAHAPAPGAARQETTAEFRTAWALTLSRYTIGYFGWYNPGYLNPDYQARKVQPHSAGFKPDLRGR